MFKSKKYEKIYAPTVAYIRTKENIIIRMPIVNKNIKKGKKISVTKQGKKYNENSDYDKHYEDSAMDISTSYDAILETTDVDNLVVEEGLKKMQTTSPTYEQCRALIEEG